MNYLGDFSAGRTVYCAFNTQQSDGTPITLSGTPACVVYKDGNTTETSTGVALTVDFDGKTGSHLVIVDTSNAFYASGSEFRVQISAGTVSSISVSGRVLALFSILNRSAATQTQVTGGSYALNSSSFAFNAALPFTTAQLNATLNANVVSIVGDTEGATGLYSLSVDYRAGTLNCGLGGDVTGDIGGKVLGGGVSTITGIGAQVSGGGGSGPTLSQIVDGVWTANIADYLEPGQTGALLNRASQMDVFVWDTPLTSHLSPGSTGLALSSAGSAGDPWNTYVPAAYPSGTAGYLFGRLTAPAGNGPLVPVPDATEENQTNAYLTTFNGHGGLQGKVSIEFILLSIPTSDSYTQAPFIRHSNTSGQLVTPLRKSTQYKAKRENGDYVTFTTGSGSTYALPAILGL